MEVGVVKWFDNAKGWGFVVGEDGVEVFVHYSQIEGEGYRTLAPGQHVQYERLTGERGEYAEHVKRVEATPSTGGETAEEHPFATEKVSGVVPKPDANPEDLFRVLEPLKMAK